MSAGSPPRQTRQLAAMATMLRIDDARRERQAIATEAELAWHVSVASEDRRQPREGIERGVRGQEQNHRGERLEEVERDRCVAEDGRRDLADDRLDRGRRLARCRRRRRRSSCRRKGHRAGSPSRPASAQHCATRAAGTPALRWRSPRCRSTRQIRKRKHGSQQYPKHLLGSCAPGNGSGGGWPSPRTTILNMPADHEQCRGDEDVSWDREDVARLAQAAHVAEHDQHDRHRRDRNAPDLEIGTAEITCSTADGSTRPRSLRSRSAALRRRSARRCQADCAAPRRSRRRPMDRHEISWR